MIPVQPVRAGTNGVTSAIANINAPANLVSNNALDLAGVSKTVVLAADVVNNNGSANTIADVTGLSFAVEAGKLYQFEFMILFSANATTTGSRWAINGPAAPTYLCYSSEYSLTSTTSTRNANVIAYDSPAGANATSGATSSNVAYLLGFIQPSASGTVIARFASEVSAAAITARAGSFVNWRKLT